VFPGSPSSSAALWVVDATLPSFRINSRSTHLLTHIPQSALVVVVVAKKVIQLAGDKEIHPSIQPIVHAV
jgi:hypothetical protein